MAPKITGRNLAVFTDGTSNKFGSTVTNVASLYSFVSQDPTRQLSYYQSGIGVATASSRVSPLYLTNKLAVVADLAIAYTLETHVKAAYKWLTDSYQPGDKIYLFGFSRGAYTARALASFIDSVGILHAGADANLIDEAFTIYKHSVRDEGTAEGLYGNVSLAAGFRETFARAAEVEFVGVWDTVASIGAIVPRLLPLTETTENIKCFRHAVSLDERRARFSPQLWGGNRTEMMADDPSKFRTKEIWFAGNHCDVGGGNSRYDNETTSVASHIPLVWMMREAHDAGLLLDYNSVQKSALFARYFEASSDDHDHVESKEVATHSQEISQALHAAAEATKLTKSPKLNAEQVTTYDSLTLENYVGDARTAKLSDSLVFDGSISGFFMTLMWWTMEVLPTLKVVWDETDKKDKKTVYKFSPSNGTGRRLNRSPFFHESVKFRAEDKKAHYTPHARFFKGYKEDCVTYRD